eukprot:29486-Pelagococcus_subviridis.AAC.2
MRRAKSLRNGVHHANAVVWGPAYRTRLRGGVQRRRVPRDALHELVHGSGATVRGRDDLSLFFRALVDQVARRVEQRGRRLLVAGATRADERRRGHRRFPLGREVPRRAQRAGGVPQRLHGQPDALFRDAARPRRGAVVHGEVHLQFHLFRVFLRRQHAREAFDFFRAGFFPGDEVGQVRVVGVVLLRLAVVRGAVSGVHDEVRGVPRRRFQRRRAPRRGGGDVRALGHE